MPTLEQLITCVRVCQMLSNLMQSIHLFRYDALTKQVYLIAGRQEGIEIIIFEDGNWEFYDET